MHCILNVITCEVSDRGAAFEEVVEVLDCNFELPDGVKTGGFQVGFSVVLKGEGKWRVDLGSRHVESSTGKAGASVRETASVHV